MPFAEYRGSGLSSGDDLSGMEKRWDVAWSGGAPNESVVKLAQNENWRWIREHIPPPARILEAGCGLAQWVQFLNDQGYEAYGLDYSLVALEASLATWPGLKLLKGDLRQMPYDDSFFDGIVSFGAVEHDIEGPDAALREMWRVLSPGGILYCTVPCMNGLRRTGLLAVTQWLVRNRTIRRWTGRSPDSWFFEYVFTRREYAEIMRRTGFELLCLLPLSPPVGGLCGQPGTLHRRIVTSFHSCCPWLMPHMMAAICRKV